MATIIHNKTEESKEVDDGSEIRQAAEELGIPFGCRDGLCGTCMTDIVEGADNLNELNQKEKDLERDREHRLSCQARINSGTIKIQAKE
jgi:ferredoxin